MTISTAYPDILQNGTAADATQVMADFYQIQNDVNANAAHNGANADITSLTGLTTPLGAAYGGSGVASPSAHGVLIAEGASAFTTAAPGTAGNVLTSNGASADPTFQAIQQAPTGLVSPFAGSSAPTGWLMCDGSAVSRATYATLFALIGSTYGNGDGSTTFNVPDLRGRVVAGVDNMGGSAANRITNAVSGITGTTLGAAGGNQNLHQHSHTNTLSDPTHQHPCNYNVSAGGGNSVFRQDQGAAIEGTMNTNTASTGITINNVNAGTGSSQNVQPTIMLNYIIRT